MQSLKFITTMGLAVLLVACSKTVQWEEEVPLNTGEVIWVKRSMPWEYKGGFGNPFDMAMRATFYQTIAFKYSGTEYSYTGEAQVLWIAIAADRKPVLVAYPGFSGWATENLFPCVIPYYAQLVPDATGKHWIWPEKIEPWLYGLSANLMVVIPKLDEPREVRYSAKDRNERDASYRREVPSNHRIDPNFDNEGRCSTKNDPALKPTRSEK